MWTETYGMVSELGFFFCRLFCLLSIPFYQMSDSNWSQSQEALSESASGRGKSVFSLGLGITGPDMLAAARGGR